MKINLENTKKHLIWVLKGFIMGTSDIVPGISGGTMALILNIYEKLINAIGGLFNKNNIWLLSKRRFKTLSEVIEYKFLLSLGFGILLAVFTLSHPISWLLENKPTFLWAFFFGLVSASIFFMRKKITKWPLKIWGVFLLGMIFAYIVAGLIPVQTPVTPIYFFIAGAIAISAMILPGISGSFLLVVMGKYEQILESVRSLDFMVLGIFLLGIFFGLIVFIRILSWLLKNYYEITFAFLVGLMVGSLRRVWPWKVEGINVLPFEYNTENLLIFILIAFGFGIVLALLRWNNKVEIKKEERKDEKETSDDIDKIIV
ncbi:MAG: DUF368 domain-containing protein [bacterium]|nr:DUF368 domain-containing protein [bacterium]